MSTFPRRRLAALSVAVAALLAFSACGDSESRSDESSDTAAAVRIALDYSPNVNYLGIYTAIEKGFFAEQRIDPKIIPYANTPAEPLIQAGKADLAITYPPDVIINRAKGLKYRAVAALVAHNTTSLAVLASSKYTDPAQLDGTLYGGFGIASDPAIVSAILERAGVDEPDFKQVVLNTDFLTALAKGRIQYTAVFEGIDDITAEMQGAKLRKFPYREVLGAAGDFPNAVYVASDEAIERDGDALSRALTALAQGYEYAAAHPEEAGEILIRHNEAALSNSVEIVRRSGDATSKQFLDDEGRWGTLTDADFAGLTRILLEGDVIEGTPPAPSELYTNELLRRGS